MTIRRALLGALCALSVGFWSALGHAQDAQDLAARRGLIDQAQQARTANNHQQALDLAMRASRIQMSPSLRLFIAQEQNSLGRLAEAFGNADTCMREAEADQTLRNRPQVVETCRTLAQDLRHRVGSVTVQTPANAPSDLTINVGGSELRHALWGVPYMVSPGHIAIDATASGYAAFHTEVDVAAGANSDVTLTLTAQGGGAANSSSNHQSSSSQASSGSPSNGNNNAGHASSGGGGVPIVPIVAIVAGVLLIGGGAVFLYLYFSELNTLAALCPPNSMGTDVCAPNNRDTGNADSSLASTWGIVSGVMGGVGLAAIVVGAVLFAIRPSQPAPSAMLDVSPLPGGGAVFGLRGTF